MGVERKIFERRFKLKKPQISKERFKLIRSVIGWIIIAALAAVMTLIFTSPGPSIERFLRAFGHPLFLSEKHSAFFVECSLGKYRRVSAEYPLSPTKFGAVKKEEAIDPFECARNMLTIKFSDLSASWCFEDGPQIDGRPDRVDGYKFSNLPYKIQKKLLKKYTKTVKYLTKELEEKIAIRFKVAN